MTDCSSQLLCIFDRVKLVDGNSGFIQFMGPIDDTYDPQYGIQLDEPNGNTNGTLDDIQYFICPENYGTFATKNEIALCTKSPESKKMPFVCLGDRVKIVHKHTFGTLKFVGITSFAAGIWYGSELEEPLGKNDGSVGERQYFQAQSYYGLLCQQKNIKEVEKYIKIQNNTKNVIHCFEYRGIHTFMHDIHRHLTTNY